MIRVVYVARILAPQQMLNAGYVDRDQQALLFCGTRMQMIHRSNQRSIMAVVIHG